MSESSAEWRARIGLAEFRAAFPEFGIQRDASDDVVLAGSFTRKFTANGLPDIVDTFDVSIHIPRVFPSVPIRVFDRGNRVPKDYHRIKEEAFCLSSPMRVDLFLRRGPSLLGFFERFVDPYLYRFSYIEKFKANPWPELEHGTPGILQDYSRLLGADSSEECVGLLHRLGERKRVANKRPCPCASGLRLGRCCGKGLSGNKCSILQGAPI